MDRVMVAGVEREAGAGRVTLLWACAVLLALGGVVGCGEEPPPVAERDQVMSEGVSETSKSNRTSGVIPEHQLNALRKAGGVEAQLREAEVKRRTQLETLGD